jgi:hypothetical protein
LLTKNMKIGIAYATCDGQYVVPDGDPAKKWVRETAVKDGKRVDVLVELETADPWGGCSNVRHKKYYGVAGVRVKQFEVDADGKPLGKGDRTVVRAADIKGTWDEYMTLYAEKVRKAGKKKERDKRHREITTGLAKVLGPLGLSVGWGYETPMINKPRLSPDKVLNFKLDDEYFLEVSVGIEDINKVIRATTLNRVIKQLKLERL